MKAMAEADPKSFEKTVRHPKTGELVVVRGYGSMKGKLQLDPRIDLTKPIYEQVLKLEEADKAAARRTKR